MTDEVTQADRDAAAEWMRAKHPDCAFTDLSITIARHRQQTVAAEVAKIVAWLRQTTDSYSFGTYERCSEMRSYWQSAADAIERGDYKETSGE